VPAGDEYSHFSAEQGIVAITRSNPTSRARSFAFDVRRAMHVLFIAFKYGALLLVRQAFGFSTTNIEKARRFRRAIEQLGLTYLKLGQFLALRYDLLPAEVCGELNKLFEQVAPLPFELIREVVETELGGPIQTFFADFETVPIASASVAQVHRAYTRENEKVAVKVQRPEIREIFAADMRNLCRTAAVADALRLGGSLSLRAIIDEFAAWTWREMNFVIEGQTADHLRRDALPYEVVPRVYWNLTTERVLTLEFIEGTTLVQLLDLMESGQPGLIFKRLPNLDIELAADRIARAVLHQLFVTGFFHADPHPGNLIIRDDNTVAFIDFGIYGELSQRQREILRGHIENIAAGNIEESFRYYAMQYIPTRDTDHRDFEREGKRILRNWYDASIDRYAPAKDRHLATHGAEMLDVVRRNRLRLNVNTLLFWRALYTLDSIALRLSEYVDLMSQMRRFFEETSPSFGERVGLLITDRTRMKHFEELGRSVPADLGPWFQKLSEGNSHLLIKTGASPPLRRSYTLEARGLVFGLMGISVAMWVNVSGLQILPIVITVLFMATALISVSRQR
jgi:ubiquinone biosynthesis protein